MKYQGDSKLGVSLTVQTPKPLDTRLVVDTKADLYSIPAEYAYEGMPVVCLADNNIYILVDKSLITEQTGWKSSYESVQIIYCTESEYNTWKENTNDDFTAKDDTQPRLYPNTYYYVDEESIEDKGQYHVTQSQLDSVIKVVNTKATSTELNNLSKTLQQNIDNLDNKFATLDDIDSTNKQSKLSQTLDNYYTKTVTDDKFVTKESLRGDNIDGDDFVFVTQTQYNKDQESLKTYQEETSKELDKKIDTDSSASLNSLDVKTITNGSNTLSIGETVTIDGNALALSKDIPNIVVMDQQEYEELETKDPNTYYMTHGTESDNSGMVTSAYLEENYYNQLQTIQLLKDIIKQLCEDNNLTYSTFKTVEVEKPTDKSFYYDGEIHALESNEYYTVTGNAGSAVGTYRFKLVLNGGKWWTDGTNSPIFVTYTIKTAPALFGNTFPIEFTDYDITNSYTQYGDELPIQFT